MLGVVDLAVADAPGQGGNQVGRLGTGFVGALASELGQEPTVAVREQGDARPVQPVGLHLVDQGAVEAFEGEQRVGQQLRHRLGGGIDVVIAQGHKAPLWGAGNEAHRRLGGKSARRLGAHQGPGHLHAATGRQLVQVEPADAAGDVGEPLRHQGPVAGMEVGQSGEQGAQATAGRGTGLQRGARIGSRLPDLHRRPGRPGGPRRCRRSCRRKARGCRTNCCRSCRPGCTRRAWPGRAESEAVALGFPPQVVEHDARLGRASRLSGSISTTRRMWRDMSTTTASLQACPARLVPAPRASRAAPASAAKRAAT